jgi:hypothetical protein
MQVQMLQNSDMLQDSCIDESGFVCNQKILMKRDSQFNLVARLVKLKPTEDDEW